MIKFVGSFETVKSLPNTQFAEYAFVGRSNVGKSSLINAIVNEKIARTSNTPGRTQSLNLFNFNDKAMIVDLPGYGFARVSKADALRWYIFFILIRKSKQFMRVIHAEQNIDFKF